MAAKNERKSPAPESPASRSGLQLMALILAVMALLAVYSNVQKARLDKIETVTILPVPATPSPTAAAP
ncbi:MAG: hypothetical protein M3Q89_09360 [Verrucomicrobiota bacterium]|nr:hypothetical protein [Verrucomicrobiota bacterium]